MNSLNPLQQMRLQYKPALPKIFADIKRVHISLQKNNNKQSYAEPLQGMFPYTFDQSLAKFVVGEERECRSLKIGVVLSGGQAPGGHNVISGLFDAIKEIHPESILIGFLGGPSGIINNETRELTSDIINDYRNQGGFDIIGSGRTKIEKPEQLEAAEVTVRKLGLDGLVIVGGDDSNTNAAVMAEYFKSRLCDTKVIGVPKTIDGDLKSDFIEISFGNDTACKTYSALIGNIARDALSAKKYYHFVRLMGRSASHIVLECTLQNHPNVAIISEEVAQQKHTLSQIASNIADIVCMRAEEGKNYGVVLVPEGLLEFIPEFKQLIRELNILLAKGSAHSHYIEELSTDKERAGYICGHLDEASRRCFETIPHRIQQQLLMDRDPHGNVRVSQIDTEQIIIAAVKNELFWRHEKGKYNGSFKVQGHFMGYEGRSGFPSNFDCKYCYALGYVAAALVNDGMTGYVCSLQKLVSSVEDWEATGVPLISMMDIEQRGGVPKPVIRKVLVDLDGKPFKTFAEHRHQWSVSDDYRYPGPIQFFGDLALTDPPIITLHLES